MRCTADEDRVQTGEHMAKSSSHSPSVHPVDVYVATRVAVGSIDER